MKTPPAIQLPSEVPSQRLKFLGDLVRGGWLYRKIQLRGDVSGVLEYSGWGLGYEQVLFNGRVAARVSSMVWFEPRLNFELPDGLRGSVEVGVWPWFRIKRFRVAIEGIQAYTEGRWPATPIDQTWLQAGPAA
jgi:hypothetical protein